MATKEMVLKDTHKNLMSLIESKRDAMPDDFNATRFIQNCMTVIQDTKDIDRCNPLSVARTLLKGAFLGLDFFQKECYAIPYGNDLQFQTDYKGEIKMAKKYSLRPIREIYAKVVREGDEFIEIINEGQQSISFRPVSFSNSPIIGAFAVVMFEDGCMSYETMSTDQIEGIRNNFSKMKNGLMWTKTPEEAYKKTVLRRLTKLIEKDFVSVEQAKAYEESSDSEFKKPAKEKINVPNTFAAAVDIEYQQVEETPAQQQEIKVDLTGSPFEGDES